MKYKFYNIFPPGWVDTETKFTSKKEIKRKTKFESREKLKWKMHL